MEADQILSFRFVVKTFTDRACGETQPQKLPHCCGWCFAHSCVHSELAPNPIGMDQITFDEGTQFASLVADPEQQALVLGTSLTSLRRDRAGDCLG